MFAEHVRIVLDGILSINPLVTAITEDGRALSAVFTNPITLYVKYLVNRMCYTAAFTN